MGRYVISSAIVYDCYPQLGGGSMVCVRSGELICWVWAQWFHFDDSVVSLATEAQVLGAKAYLLFYVVRSLSTS